MVRHVKGKEKEEGAEKGESTVPKEGCPTGARPYSNRLCQNQGPGKGGGGGNAWSLGTLEGQPLGCRAERGGLGSTGTHASPSHGPLVRSCYGSESP